ncbi:MAG: septation protein SepH [Actinomycetaceae bacterium]|nr:septation protein SepH [Actinomycetaceae bacterium]
MIDLEFLDVHPDRTRLVLTDSDGQRYLLPITDSLRTAVRIERPLLHTVKPTPGTDTLAPRDIQVLIRMGSTSTDIARQFNVPLESIRPYEKPIHDERRYIAQMAQRCRIGNDKDAPTMGDLVVDRLAARGVDPDTIDFDAIRSGQDPWEVIVTFVQSAIEKEAHWSFDVAAKSLTALDQEAIWLTETAVSSHADPFGVSRPLPWEQEETDIIATISSPSSQVPPSQTPPLSAPPEPSPTRATGTELLLDELNAQRGIRQSIDMSEFDDSPAEDAHEIGDILAPTGKATRSPQNTGVTSTKKNAPAKAGSVLPFRKKEDDVTDPHVPDNDVQAPLSNTQKISDHNTIDPSLIEDTDTTHNTVGSTPNNSGTADATTAHGATSKTSDSQAGKEHTDTKKIAGVATKAAQETNTTNSTQHCAQSGHETGVSQPVTDVLPGLEAPDAPPARKHPQRTKKRRSVPSWDEIVFGARTSKNS